MSACTIASTKSTNRKASANLLLCIEVADIAAELHRSRDYFRAADLFIEKLKTGAKLNCEACALETTIRQLETIIDTADRSIAEIAGRLGAAA